MKALSWIGAGSFALNLALVAYIVTRPSAPDVPVSQALARPEPAPAAPAPSAEARSAFVRADTPLAKILDGTDLPALRAALEATGLTEDDAKAIIRTRIRNNQKSARDAISQRRSPRMDTWWYQDNEADQKFEEQRRADYRVLNEEVTQKLAVLFGAEPQQPESQKTHEGAAFLPAAKRLAVSEILRDYEAMQREARPRNFSGASLPSDEEKTRFINEERRKDLAAVLTPEELRSYDLRNSETARNLRWNLGAMKPSLAEYEAIYAAADLMRGDFDTSGSGEKPPEFWKKRAEAEKASIARLREQLGEDRFVDYALSRDYNSRQVNLVVERYALPKDTARTLWSMRRDAGEIGKVIYDDPKLNDEAKRARLAELAQISRQKLNQILDPTSQTELKQNNLVDWVDALERKQITVYNELGDGSRGFGL
jgi:hypothetical protein